jgi:hypothetical protein
MPIQNFAGQTFVAFTDIAGFKARMKDERRGPEALDALYSWGYQIIANQPADRPRVEGLFVSDCGILFVREHPSAVTRLEALLLAVEQLNRRCFERAVILTTSVAWGEFSYHQRLEVLGIAKDPIYGHAYIAAYVDSENDSPKLYPTECRIVKRNLPDDVLGMFENHQGPIGARSRDSNQHYYFEWMRPGEELAPR